MDMLLEIRIIKDLYVKQSFITEYVLMFMERMEKIITFCTINIMEFLSINDFFFQKISSINETHILLLFFSKNHKTESLSKKEVNTISFLTRNRKSILLVNYLV